MSGIGEFLSSLVGLLIFFLPVFVLLVIYILLPRTHIFVSFALYSLFFFIFLPPLLVSIGVPALAVFILCVSGLLISIYSARYLGYRREHKEWLPRYEEWKKTANEMGFNEVDRARYKMIIGKYRNQNVTIDEIDLGSHDSDSGPDLKTRYSVDFENPQMILLHIRRSFPHSFRYSSLRKHIRDIHLDNPQLLEGLVINGNNENAIKSILDSSICNKIMNIKDSLYEMEIGYGKLGYGKHKWLPIEIEIESNVARYIDSRSLQETKGNALKFRLIIDTLINIVEKIEKLTPPFCSNCGCKLQNDDKFCYRCGAPVSRLPIQ